VITDLTCRLVSELQPMAMHLITERLSLRPWAESDVENYRTLVTERGAGRPTDEEIRERISSQLATTSRTGIALLAVSRQ
jgi:hypothetical protein